MGSTEGEGEPSAKRRDQRAGKEFRSVMIVVDQPDETRRYGLARLWSFV